jgi:hypothetical protein
MCGIHSLYIPRSHPDGIDVNISCLDGDVIGNFEMSLLMVQIGRTIFTS